MDTDQDKLRTRAEQRIADAIDLVALARADLEHVRRRQADDLEDQVATLERIETGLRLLTY